MIRGPSLPRLLKLWLLLILAMLVSAPGAIADEGSSADVVRLTLGGGGDRKKWRSVAVDPLTIALDSHYTILPSSRNGCQGH